jgi:large subunit ribosomal protein L13
MSETVAETPAPAEAPKPKPVSPRTTIAKKETVTPRWYVVDGTNQVVGRLAVQIANIIRGKHKPDYTPHVDTGDFVIVVNADKVKFTGKKWEQKEYQHFTHYAGGLKITSAKEMLAKKPEEILYQATKRMVPRNRLGRQQMTKLKLYAGPQHPHQAQQPQELKIDTSTR